MTRIILTTILFFMGCSSELLAQKLFRSERPTYTLREDAMSGFRSDSSRFMMFENMVDDTAEFDLPYEWLDENVMLHLDGGVSPRTIVVNGFGVAHNSDFITPCDYQINNYLKEGRNKIEILTNDKLDGSLSDGIALNADSNRTNSTGLYIYAEPRRRIYDYDVRITPDSTRKFAWLEIDALVENGFNYEEETSIGFDVYSPDGRLLDYSTRPVIIEGLSRDTVRFRTHIYNADSMRWSPDSPALYSVTLLTKSGAVVESYTPIRVGYSDLELRDGALYNFGKKVEIKPFRFNAKSTIDETADELYRVKDAGYNTLRPSYPQPLWFYELCNEMGFYIIEQTSINAPQDADSRKIGGSPSNNPWLVGEYLDRVRTSYYRVRQHPSVIAFSLGAESGNGYNMYKAYEWFKSVGDRRPVIYDGAQGEWNSDIWER